MRNLSYLRKSLATGILMAFTAAPFCLMAQSASSPSSMPQQQQPSSMQQQQAPSSMTPSSTSDQSTSSNSSSNETVPGKVDDTWITTKVKSKFAAAKGIKASDITVNTSDGAVTLTGTATSKSEKNHAVRLAKGVKGVKTVDASGLTVGSSSSSSSGGSSSGSESSSPSSGATNPSGGSTNPSGGSPNPSGG
ncbi:BON domain-containing protein [Dyella sp. 2HG41-7]|uniref:BON domain-containing protein n=1 Tax=Dyella sp. 2HG41-7 TaxID=2883239 RepID=UPI001F1C5936|nr:BON domain-containing protein [Dyella sp. 2HG41-7]